MLDNVFAPRIVRIPVGGTVEWTNEGRSPHNVTADDGAFASADLASGEVFDETFATEGAYPYFCSIHGSPGAGMTGLVLVGDAPIPGAASDVGSGSRDAALAARRRDPCAAGRADDPGRGGRGRAGGDRRHLARRLRGGGGRDDAVPHDPGSGSQRGDPRGRVHARQRDLGDRGRRRDDREHDRPALPRERVPVVERVRLPRVVPDGVQRRRLRAVRVRLAVRAVRPLVRERPSRLRLLHRPVLPVSRRDHRRARREQRRGIFGHERRRRPVRRELRVARQPRGDRAQHPGLRRARAAARRPDRRQLGARQQQRGRARRSTWSTRRSGSGSS